MIIVYMLVIHFVADFLMQSREMGQKKSSEFKWLLKHLAIIFTMFFICLVIPMGVEDAFKFALYNMLIHGVIDWHIWKLYKLSTWWRVRNIVVRKYGMWSQPFEEDSNVKAEIAAWKYYEDHWFYSTIGFDQLLHSVTLVLLVKYIIVVVLI